MALLAAFTQPGTHLLAVPCCIQGSAKGRAPGFMNFVGAVAYHFCLAFPAAFKQPGTHLLAEPCNTKITPWRSPSCNIEIGRSEGQHGRVKISSISGPNPSLFSRVNINFRPLGEVIKISCGGLSYILRSQLNFYLRLQVIRLTQSLNPHALARLHAAVLDRGACRDRGRLQRSSTASSIGVTTSTVPCGTKAITVWVL